MLCLIIKVYFSLYYLDLYTLVLSILFDMFLHFNNIFQLRFVHRVITVVI